jgi:hypothetical protein
MDSDIFQRENISFIPYQISHDPKLSGRRVNGRDLSARTSKYGRMGEG